MNLPQTYAKSPIAPPPGSLEATLKPAMGGIDKNFSLIQASITQIIAFLKFFGATVTTLQSAVSGLTTRVVVIENSATRVVTLTAESGGSEWDLAEVEGYPSLRAVIIDPDGEANTLNLPSLGATDRLCITIKCLTNSGSVSIEAGASEIVTAAGGASSYSIPYSIVADGTTFTTYAATLAWDGTAWQVLDNAILVV